MNIRLLTALAVSGAVHAGAFVLGAGLVDHFTAGLQDSRITGTLTVSVVLDSIDTTETDTASTTAPSPEQSVRRSLPFRPVQKEPIQHKPVPKPQNSSKLENDATPNPEEVPHIDKSPETNEPSPDELDPSDARDTRRIAAAAQPSAIAGDRSSKPSDSDEVTYLSEFLAELSKYKHYPRSARVSRQQGKVVVDLLLQEDGRISEVSVSEASRYPALNRAALRSVRQMKQFKPFPDTLNRSEWRLSVPFKYAIDNG